MGLKDLFSNWTKKRDKETLDRVASESQMTPRERALESGGLDAHKADVAATANLAGAESITTASDELE